MQLTAKFFFFFEQVTLSPSMINRVVTGGKGSYVAELDWYQLHMWKKYDTNPEPV